MENIFGEDMVRGLYASIWGLLGGVLFGLIAGWCERRFKKQPADISPDVTPRARWQTSLIGMATFLVVWGAFTVRGVILETEQWVHLAVFTPLTGIISFYTLGLMDLLGRIPRFAPLTRGRAVKIAVGVGVGLSMAGEFLSGLGIWLLLFAMPAFLGEEMLIVFIVFPIGIIVSLIGGGCVWIIIVLSRVFRYRDLQEILREAAPLSWWETSLSSIMICGIMLVMSFAVASPRYGLAVAFVAPVVIAGIMGLCWRGLLAMLSRFPRLDLFTKGRTIGIGIGCGLGFGLAICWMALMSLGWH